MFDRYDINNGNNEFIERYDNEEYVVKDATRFYHEHFTMEENYDENFEVKTFEQAKELFEANGYAIRKVFFDKDKCPICGSQKISYCGSEIQNPYLFYRCICDDCNTTYDEYYELVYAGLENIIRGDRNENI